MEESSTTLARFSCQACRKQKRKCSRELPSCDLCRKNRRQCEYPPDSVYACYEDANNKTLLHTLQARSAFPPLFFLDSDLFGSRRSVLQLPGISLPQELSYFITSEGGNIASYVSEYFSSAHHILPFVSKHRFLRRISSTSHIDVDTALLLLCMRMISQPGDQSVYPIAKQCLLTIESQGRMSIMLLQSAILLALHESGSAIYPTAFFTIGHCARLGQAMGLHDRRHALQMFPKPTSFTELEEVRRTWWAVIVLDRFVNVGLENRPFACADAQPEDLLPMDESLWEKGEQATIPSLAVSADASMAVSAYARTCQASHLLSRVISLINSNSVTSNRRDYYLQALQLHHIVSAFSTGLFEEVMADGAKEFTTRCSAMGICFSAMIALYYTHTCAELDDLSGVGIPEQLSMQKLSLETLHKVGASVCEFASKIVNIAERDPPRIPANLFITGSIYGAAKQYLWLIRETGNDEYLARAKLLTELLQYLGDKLQVANEYLLILDGDEFNPNS